MQFDFSAKVSNIHWFQLHEYVFVCVRLLVGWLVGWIVGRIAELTSTKLGLRTSLGPEQTQFTFGVNPDKRTDPGIFFNNLSKNNRMAQNRVCGGVGYLRMIHSDVDPK